MSECGCLYGGWDDDGVTGDFQSTSTPKARKPHVCEECRRVINPGERYHRTSGRWDGEMNAHICCLECDELRTAFYCDGGWYFGQLLEDIEAQMFQRHALNSACLEKLKTVDAKQHLQRLWWTWVERQAV